jgi:hydroxyethylthiazole kinase-like uncharacterized protein yjeF
MPKEPIPEAFEGLPVVTADRMRTIDHLAAEKFGLTTLILMENAGRAVAEETAAFMKEKLGLDIAGAAIVVCCGRGANGGDGLVAARHLSEKGAKVSVILCPPRKDAEYPDYFQSNLEKAKAAGVTVTEAGPDSGLAAALAAAAVALDALLGTGSAGKPAGAIHHMIQEINRSKKPVLAVDIPSGIQPDTGYHSGVFITAARTLTLGLPKRGLMTPHAKRNVGELKVLDIGYPRGLFEGKS